MTMLLEILLLLFLIVCALSVAYLRDLLSAVIVFGAYTLVMAVIWQMLGSPDIAVTEAALGSGVTVFLFIATISKTRRSE